MGRARKDSFNQPPVETYRKFIGKHENKKSKSDIKESKKRVQSKKTKSKKYKEIAIMLGFLTAALFGGYALSYVLLTGSVSSLWASVMKNWRGTETLFGPSHLVCTRVRCQKYLLVFFASEHYKTVAQYLLSSLVDLCILFLFQCDVPDFVHTSSKLWGCSTEAV